MATHYFTSLSDCNKSAGIEPIYVFGSKTQGPTAEEMMADFLGTCSDDDTGSSTDSDTDSDQEMACDDEEKLLTTTVDVEGEKPQAHTGLKIILPPRRLSGSAAAAERTITDPPIDYEDVDEVGDEELADFGYDTEMEDEIEEPEHNEYASIPPLRSRQSARRMRSPLSASHSGVLPVYAAHQCAIQGCNFSASSAQHLRHHMASASHSLSFRRAGARMTG